MPIKIHIRHWTCWGHAPRAEDLKAQLEEKNNDLEITLEGVSEPAGEFSVFINDELIHDKAGKQEGFCSVEKVLEKLPKA